MVKTHPRGRTLRAVVQLDAPPVEGESETQSRTVGVALLEWPKQTFGDALRETAALVGDLDEHAILAGGDAQSDARPRARELEHILEQIHDHRRQNLPVGMDRQASLASLYRESEAAIRGLLDGHRCQFLDQFGDNDVRAITEAVAQPDLGDGPVERSRRPARLRWSVLTPGSACVPSPAAWRGDINGRQPRLVPDGQCSSS